MELGLRVEGALMGDDWRQDRDAVTPEGVTLGRVGPTISILLRAVQSERSVKQPDCDTDVVSGSSRDSIWLTGSHRRRHPRSLEPDLYLPR